MARPVHLIWYTSPAATAAGAMLPAILAVAFAQRYIVQGLRL